MTQFVYTLVLLFSPLPVLIAVGRIRMLRRRVAEEDALPRPFAPKPEPTPSFWLRRFSLPERTYRRQQAGTAKYGFYIVVWSVAVLMSSTLLPGEDSLYGWFKGDPALIWNGYLRSAFLLNGFGVIFSLVTGFTAAIGLSAVGPYAVIRTRPLTRRLLYWGRVGTALLTLLAGYATGIAISFALLVVLRGPVWQQLNVNGQGLRITLVQMHRLAWMFDVSLTRLFVSTATSMSMMYSLVVFASQMPSRFLRLPRAVGGLLGLAIYFIFSQFVLPSHVSRMFFIYISSTNVPPPWSAAMVPVGITAAFLICGQFAFSHSEP